MKRLTKFLASAALIISMCLTGLTAHAANHVSALDAAKTNDEITVKTTAMKRTPIIPFG